MHLVFYRYARIMIIVVATLAVVLMMWPTLASAGPELPPRDPLDKVQDGGGGGGDGDSVGAYIVLQTDRGAWAVVQWQDSAGNWHDVEGWRGSNDPY
ncbi:MAG: hypothetical protein R3264_07350, partial [Anaerolineae bacterium]|nr:hypothetical protein [Anaerolineae bacterium]